MRRTGPDMQAVDLVLARDRHCCRRCAMTLHGQRGTDWVIHHRRPRGMGGTRRVDTNSPANLVALCTRCHVWIESYRDESRRDGWLVSQHDDPERVPLQVGAYGDDWTRTRWVYLLVDGSESDYGPDHIAPATVLDEATVHQLRTVYPHLLAEAAQRAEEDMAVLAVELHPEAAARGGAA